MPQRILRKNLFIEDTRKVALGTMNPVQTIGYDAI